MAIRASSHGLRLALRPPRRLMRSCLLAASVIVAAPASAQYFGRNKVQYKKLDFQVLKTEHFDIYFYPDCVATAASQRPLFDGLVGTRMLVGNLELRFRCCGRSAHRSGCTVPFQSKSRSSPTAAWRG